MAKKDCTVWQASNWSSLGFARVVCLLGVCLFHICSLHADTRQFWAHAFWGAGVEERFLGRSDAVLHSGGGVEGLIRSGFGVVLEAGYFSGAEGETGGVGCSRPELFAPSGEHNKRHHSLILATLWLSVLFLRAESSLGLVQITGFLRSGVLNSKTDTK